MWKSIQKCMCNWSITVSNASTIDGFIILFLKGIINVQMISVPHFRHLCKPGWQMKVVAFLKSKLPLMAEISGSQRYLELFRIHKKSFSLQGFPIRRHQNCSKYKPKFGSWLVWQFLFNKKRGFFDIDRPNRVLKSQEKIEQKLWNRFLFFGSIFSYFSKPEVRL